MELNIIHLKWISITLPMVKTAQMMLEMKPVKWGPEL